MVPVSHEIQFPTSEKLREYLSSAEFGMELVSKLKEQYEVGLVVKSPTTTTNTTERQSDEDVGTETLILSYTLNNAGGAKDAVDFLLVPLIANGLEASTIKGANPRPKLDSFEDNLTFFDSKILQPAEQSVLTEEPSQPGLPGTSIESRSFFGKFRKPSSIGSFGSFLERRKNGSSSPNSLFKHASSNASKASLVSMESRDSGYRNPWNDSGIDLEHDSMLNGHGSAHGHGWGSFGASSSRPNTSSNSLSGAFETKFPFGTSGNASSTSLSMPLIPGLGMVNGNGVHTPGHIPGDVTPKNDSSRSVDGDTSEAKKSPADSAVAQIQSVASAQPEAETAVPPENMTTTVSASALQQNTQGYPKTQEQSKQ